MASQVKVSAYSTQGFPLSHVPGCLGMVEAVSGKELDEEELLLKRHPKENRLQAEIQGIKKLLFPRMKKEEEAAH